MLKNYLVQCGLGRAVVQAVDAEDALNEAIWQFGHRAQPKVIGLADDAAIAQFSQHGEAVKRYSPLPKTALAA